jgi:gluconolactonase
MSFFTSTEFASSPKDIAMQPRSQSESDIPQTDVSRRAFLTTSAVTAAALSIGIPQSVFSGVGTDRYMGLESEKYLGKVGIETKVVDEEIFTEGPACDRAGNLYFTNTSVAKILKWDPKAGKLSVFRKNSGAANGLLFAPNGDLLACEGANGRVTRTDIKNGKITVLADNYKGRPLAAPNDLTLDGKGRVYFTSRTGNPPETAATAVYRIDPDGKLTQLLAAPDTTDMPNGIVTSPDNKTLYLIEAHPQADHLRNIRAFDLGADGSLSNGRVHINFYPGRSGDGMCIDARGNLYVAAGLHKTRKTSETLDTKPGIHVISPAGKLVAYVETPEDTITNCTFGGKDLRTLYVACGTLLLSIPTKIPGKAAYRPGA